MGIFAGGKSGREDARRANLRILEDKRLEFAQRMQGVGFSPERTLYIQREGGFRALAADGDEVFLLFGPGPGEDADFSMERFPRGALKVGMRVESIAPTGAGGAFGLGTRGAEGFTYLIEKPDGQKVEMTLLSGSGAYLEANRVSNALLSLKRARGDANFVWALSPGSAREVMRVGRDWLARVTE